MRQRLVIGNWKMHGSLAANLGLLHALKQGSLVIEARGGRAAVCVPYPYLYQARSVLGGTPVSWGAQDVSEFLVGAYTGEVSADMLSEFGCRYVLVGHSERRAYFGDTDTVVAAKTCAALKMKLTPVVCVGETLADRDAGVTGEVVLRQLDAVIARCGVKGLASCVVAYEPVWAIGTGRTATPAQAQEVHAMIRERVASLCVQTAQDLTILYGGSVKPESAAGLFAQPDIDGGLIGGASLIASDFLAICCAA
jgi:triosephosphate isomerase